jgi:hypothetical protein
MGMTLTRLRTGIALLVLGGLAGIASGQSAGETLEVVRVKARFAQTGRTAESRHMLKLTLRVTPRQAPYQHVGEQHPLRVTLDGVDLCNAAAGAAGYQVRKNGRWKYRGDVAGGRVRLSGDGRSGKVRLKVSGAHLPDLKDSPATDLELSLELANTLFETTASFRVLDRRVRRWNGLVYAYPPRPGPDPGPGPGPGPNPDPAPTGEALKAAILADMQRRGVSYMSGSWSPAGGFDAMTKRCPSGALAEVVILAAPPPGTVDGMTDAAYFCRDRRQYWAHRTGGFAGFNLWIGPFTLP